MSQKTLASPISNKGTLDVSVNITAHKEGYYIHKTIKAAVECCEYARVHGSISSTIQIHLDNPDSLTERIVERAITKYPNIIKYKNNFGDPSVSRNFLISKSKSSYILFWDGDDLFTENYIYESYRVARSYKHPCVVSAKNIIKFNNNVDPVVYMAESTLDKPEIKSAFFETNLYISQNFVSTEVYKTCKYESNNDNYGFEDWHWNTKVINAGYEFLVAPNTSFFYRQKPDDKSLLKKHTTSNTVLRQSSLFKPVKFQTLTHKEYYRASPPKIEIAYQSPIKTKGREVLNRISPNNGAFYRGAKLTYRTIQTSVAPALHHLRSKTSTSREDYSAIQKPQTETHNNNSGVKKFFVIEEEVKFWNKLNKIEPLLYFSKSVIAGLHEYKYTFEHSLASAYYLFCKTYAKKKFTDIIFVPWINKGGADLAILDLARVLTSNGRFVLLITTSGVESQWYQEAASIKGLTIIQSHDKIFNDLDHLNIKLLFLRIIQNWGIKSVTVMNSSIGFELLNRYGRAIKDAGCRTIVHNFAFPEDNGLMIEAFPSFSASLEFIDFVIVDSLQHKQLIEEIYGLPDEIITKIPLPMTEGLIQKNSNPTKKILFANRLAREKQPQVALEVARKLANAGIHMDIYGTKDEQFCNEIKFDEVVADIQNVSYKKSFNGSKVLNFDDYDICFMPSLYEGIPRIALDSIKANLFVVCTSVGGLPEIVMDGENGILLPSNATADDFADAIMKYYKTPSLQDIKKRKSFNSKIVGLHSYEYHKTLLEGIYLDKNEGR